MPWSEPSAQPVRWDGYTAVFNSTRQDSDGNKSFYLTITPAWEVLSGTEADWDAVFQSLVDSLVASGNFEFANAEKKAATQWNLTPTETPTP